MPVTIERHIVFLVLFTVLIGCNSPPLPHKNQSLNAKSDHPDVARLLNAPTCLKHQAALSVAYGAGLRVAEVSTLKVADVDSELGGHVEACEGCGQ